MKKVDVYVNLGRTKTDGHIRNIRLKNKYAFEICFVERANGNCPSKEFYDGLDKAVKAKFWAIGKQINESRDGFLRDTEKLAKLHGKHTDDLWEMKVYHHGVWYRILCFRDGSAWMLTNGFRKKGNSTSPTEIERGVTIKREYLKAKRAR